MVPGKSIAEMDDGLTAQSPLDSVTAILPFKENANMKAATWARLSAVSGLSLMTTCCVAAICDAALVQSTQLEPAKYQFRFAVQMDHCPFVACETTIKYQVNYTELLNGGRIALDRRYLFSARISNGQKQIDDTVTVSASRFDPRVEDLEILGVSCL
jgi:hypothetical protein